MYKKPQFFAFAHNIIDMKFSFCYSTSSPTYKSNKKLKVNNESIVNPHQSQVPKTTPHSFNYVIINLK